MLYAGPRIRQYLKSTGQVGIRPKKVKEENRGIRTEEFCELDTDRIHETMSEIERTWQNEENLDGIIEKLTEIERMVAEYDGFVPVKPKSDDIVEEKDIELDLV